MADYDLNPELSGGLLGGGGGGSWLGNLFNFGGGRSTTADLYGDLFTKKQLAAIQQRESQAKMAGLLGAINQFAAPSEFKKNWGQLLGTAGQAMLGGGEAGDKAATTALGGQLNAAKIAQLRQAAASKAAFNRAIEQLYGPGGPLSGGAGAPPVPPAGAVPQPGAPPMPGQPVAPTSHAPPPPPGAGPGGFAFGTGAPRPFAMPGATGGGPAVLPPTPPGPGADPGAGAGMPPIDPASQYAMMMGGGLLGAGGGGAQPPFPAEGSASLPPPDTVIPSGGGGLLDPDAVKLAAFSGGGGLPADLDWLNKNAPFRTLAKPQGDPIKWRYDTPVIDPSDPASQGPGSPFGPGPGAATPTYESVLGRRQGGDPLLTQAQMRRTGGSGGGAPPVASGGGAPAAAGGGGLDDPVPGLGVTMRDIARIDALAAAADEPSPFKTLLDAYYKTPGYLGQAAEAESRARKGVELTMDPLIREQTERAALRAQLALKPELDAAIERAKNAPLAERKEAEAEVDRLTKRMEQITGAKLSSQDTVVTLPGQRPQKMRLTNEQIFRLNSGQGLPEIGIPAGTQVGEPVYSPTETALGPIEAKDIFEKKQAASDAAAMIETNREARKLLDDGVITGFAADKVTAFTKLGNALGITGRNSQEQVANTEAYIATTAGNVGKMIKQFGAGTGLSNADREYAADMVAGRITLDETSIRRILDINDRASTNIINRHNQSVSKIRPGATMTDLAVPVPEPYKPAPLPDGTIIQDAAGNKQIKRGGKWEPHL